GQSTKAALFNQTESRVRSESPVNRTVSLTTLPPPRPVGTLPPPRELGTLPPPPNFPGTSSRQEVTQTQSIKELRFGDRGSAVSQLQQKLREEGFDPGPVNGIYGVQTEEAVKQFQRANRLRVDGIAGSQTLAELGIIAKESEATGYVVVVPVRSGNPL
ncbi:MAG TPA: hypothetical protein DEG47_04215, partial [Cyanobacteria bacterium UBA11148]|nr:hypothetical protein [Cyanobacteria bacterium UBA11148]